MKKSILLFALFALTLCGYSQTVPSLYFKITTTVITSDGRSISSGAVVSFTSHPEAITNQTLPCDLNWWISEAAQDSGYANISPVTKLYKGESLTTAYLPVTVPPQQFSYSVFQGWAKTWLESKFGSGKVTILN